MASTTLHLLLIEDNPGDALLLKDALGRDAWVTFRVTVAERLREALALGAQQPFDVVLLDLGLPDSQGLETFTRFHNAVPQAAVVVLSGLMDEHLAVQAVRAGAEDYLVKSQAGWDVVPRAVRYAFERRQTRAALETSERRFRALIEQSADLVVLLDAQGVIVYGSPSATRVLGYTPEALVGQPAAVLMDPAEHAGAAAGWDRVLQNPGQPFVTEWPVMHQDGSQRWLEATATNQLAVPGVAAIVVNARDITERKQAEKQMQQAERFAQATLDALSDHVCVLDQAGVILSVNQAWRDFADANPPAPAEYGVGGNYLEVCDAAAAAGDADAAAAAAGLRAVLAGEREQFALEYPCHSPETQRWFTLRITRFASAGPARFVVAHETVTSFKQAEFAVRASEARYRGLFEHMLEGFAYCRMLYENGQPQDWVYQAVNPAFETLTGLRQVAGRRVSDVIPGLRATDPALFERYGRVVSTGRPERFEIFVAALEMWFDIHVYRPEPECFVAVFDVITERKRAEAALREREALYRAVIATSADGFWMADQAGRLLEVNDAYTRRSGYSRSELLGMRIADVEAQESPAEVAARMAELQRAGGGRFETQHRTKAGALWPVEVTTAFWPIEGGYFFAFLRDLYQRQRSDTLLRARVELAELAQHGSLTELLRRALDLAERFTDSTLGFFHLVDADQQTLTLQAWSTNTSVVCQADGQGRHYPASEAGVWAESLRLRAPVIHNDYAALPQKRGVPEGHAPVLRELVVPLLADGRVSALLGVGNKPGDYTAADVETVQALAALMLDLLARKQAEAALRASEMKLRAIYQAIPVPTYTWQAAGDDFVLSDYNAIALKFTGGQIANLVGAKASTLYRDNPDILTDLARCLTEQTSFEREMDYQFRTTGVTRRFVVKYAFVAPDLILVHTDDITERQQAEAAVRRQAERTEALARLSQALAEAAADYAAVVATAVHWGAAGVGDGCVLYLLSEDGAWLEPAASDHIDPEARDYLRQVLASARYSALGSFNTQLLRGAGPVILADLTPEQVHALAQPGTPDWLERYSLSSLVAVPLRAQGETIGTFLTARQEAGRPYTQEDAHFIQEVADRAALAIVNARLLARIQRQNSELEQRVAERTADLSHVNAELQRTARAKDEFLASMSHELRTPLNAVLTLTEALADDVYGPVTDRQRRPLQLIGESGQHLLMLINDVLDLAKIEAGKLELQPMWVEVEALCQASLRLVRQQALKKRLQTTVEVGMEVRSLMADGRRLKQMLVNLLDNAVKFTPEGGQIGLEVRGDAAAGVARFTVWDTGIGIPAEDAQRLFQPFVQVQSGLDRQYGGTGLGLSLVYRMAELHGGGVGLQSVPGQGSRFTLSLPWRVNAAGPAAEPAGAEAAPAPASAPVSQPGKVLIADDNRVNQVAFADYLTFRGYQVVLAADGEEALARARADHPDIILIDVQMPRLNGLEAVRRLRADPELAGLPVIALTALAMEGDRERCLAAGADEYLAKPVNLPQLERVIEAQLKRAARRQP